MSETRFCFNGIDGATGRYLLPPLTAEALVPRVLGEDWGGPERFEDLAWRESQRKVGQLPLEYGRDPMRLDESGWGLILPAATDPKTAAAVLDALAPLREHRRNEAGSLYKEFVGAAGYQTGESRNKFLARPKLSAADIVGPGPVDPTKVPYYLLLVGDPEAIPYTFQYELDASYAVGRIHFRTPAEYASYAAAVVASETGAVVRPRRATFFGVANPGDDATRLSSTKLINPLAGALPAAPGAGGAPWQIDVIAPADARKARLGQLIGGPDAPALLFTASHGVGFPLNDPRQPGFQGALLCQDWPGPTAAGQPLSRDHYFAAEDVSATASPAGQMAFFFACYGAGTPRYDDFAHPAATVRTPIAPRAFLSALPTKLLGHPRGGALAVVGHVERAWGCSVEWAGGGDQTGAFREALQKLHDGHRLGFALEGLNNRYAEIAVLLSNLVERAKYEAVSPFELASRWVENNDARGYAILGDPAVRLAVPAGAAPAAAKIEVRVAPVPAEPLPEAPAAAPDLTPAAAPPPPPPDAAVPAFGLVGDLRDGLSSVVKQFGERLSAFVSDLASLEVSTFVADDMDQVKYDPKDGRFAGARCRAQTRIAFDGDTQVCVPQAGGKVDQALWELHLSAVREAQAHRAAMLKVVAEVLSGWLKPGAP